MTNFFKILHDETMSNNNELSPIVIAKETFDKFVKEMRP